MGNKFINIISKVIIFIAIIFSVILAFAVYSNANEETKEDGKIEEEVRYLDNKLLTIINYLNNINLQNYKMTLTKIEAESNSSGSSQKQGAEEEGQKEEESSSKDGQNNKETEITKMERETIATGNKKGPDWETIEGEVEILYSSWSPIVLDLYKINVSKEDILGFSDTIDETILGIKKQDKALTAMYIAKLYSYLPKFAKNLRNRRIEKGDIRSKKLCN
ncbi:MAG: hypothetical protein HFJ54_01605 [Clostridia bacterium]|nr:hypothetical protein [Clostridia bacterium]